MSARSLERYPVVTPRGHVTFVPRTVRPPVAWQDGLNPLSSFFEQEPSREYTRLHSHRFVSKWGDLVLEMDVLAEDEPKVATMHPLLMKLLHEVAPDLVSERKLSFDPVPMYENGRWVYA